MSSLSDFVGSAIQSLKGEGSVAVSSAANQLAQGNVGTAISDLQSGVTGALSSIGSSGGVAFADDLAGIQSRGDAVQSWCWYAVMPDITNTQGLDAYALGSIGTSIGTIQGGQPLVSCPWYYVQTGTLPFRKLNVDTFKRNGHDTHRANGYSVDSLTLGFFMDSSSKAHQYLKAWQGLILANSNPKVVSNQGNFGYPSAYIKDINIVVLSVKKNVLLNVKLINCWPTDLSSLELNSESTAMVQNVTFACEDVDVTVNNDKGLLDTLTNTVSGFALSSLQSFGGQAIASSLGNFIPGL